MGPDDAIVRLPGAGPVTAARLACRGLHRVRDLVYFLPRAYEDYRRVYPLRELPQLPLGTSVVVRGKVARVHKFFRRMLDVHLEQEGATLRARWFRPNAGMAKTYARGTEVALAGSLRRTPEGEPELVHPSNVTSLLGESGGPGIRPRYLKIEKVPGRTVEKMVGVALAAVAGALADLLPEALRRRLGLPGITEALAFLHRPPAGLSGADFAELLAGRSPAQRRLALEELFVTQVGVAVERTRSRSEQALSCGGDRHARLFEAQAALPFALTPGQQKAALSVLGAMGGESPMQCLLQGDVGSGKTAIAFAASLHMARAGGQTLLMAPTTVLAEQHRRTMGAWAERAGLRVGLLHSGLSAALQRQVLAAAESGELDVIVGTHALLEDRLRLRLLGLAIVDEQHRFGVRQRARLRRMGDGENGWQIGTRGGMVPHLLVLSATPIPRSLALTLYGDLDMVTLEGLPPGRKPVVTKLCRSVDEREAAYQALRQNVTEGGQGFVVCPAIVEDDTGGKATSVTALARGLRGKLGLARIGVLHGRLAPGKQQEIADAFREGRLDVLVATTVVEVGVDVPGARVMVIEDADRFGLAQLHQLRGRVGRGMEQAHCYLSTSSEDVVALARLALLTEVSDGFRIAEEDLRRRGAGDVQGTRQAGMPELCFADLGAYLGLVELARREAQVVLERDPGLTLPEHAALGRAVAERMREARPFAAEAG